MSAGIQQEFASSAEKGESSIRGPPVVTTNLPHMSIKRLRPTTSGATNSFHGGVVTEGDGSTVPISRIFGRFKDMPTSNIHLVFAAHTCARVVCAVRNGIECSTTTQSSTTDDVTELPPLSGHHSHSADITGRHDMRDGTSVPISIIFRRFRNPSITGLQSSYVTHSGIPCAMASKSSLPLEVILVMHMVKINDSDYQYAVSIKEDTAYPCLHSPKTTKETSSIRRIQRRPIRRIEAIVCEDSGRYQAWSLLQETPNTPYPTPWIRHIELTSRQYK
ncbi:hypothetical protein Tco_0767788 [Tanacetum coccineum]